MPDNQELTTGITGSSAATEVPQFSTAEYAHIPGTERCRICGNAIAGEYFRVNGQMACSQCAAQAKQGTPVDSHSAFARGLTLGVGAALLGLILYATFTIITGWYLGYVSLGVGWLVGAAIKKGSNGLGGRRYQIAAVLLTYAAISLASIPIIIAAVAKEQRGTKEVSISKSGDVTPSNDASEDSQASAQPKQIDWGAAAGQLALWGLASPFLELRDPVHGLLGLFILFIGLRIAFRMTAERPLSVDGPYSVTGAPA
jgi:hypothetical protein